MLDQLIQWLTTTAWWGYLLRIILIFFVAWLIQRLMRRLVDRTAQFSRFRSRTRRPRPEREATLRGLMTGMISFILFGAATLASLAQFVEADTLVWMVGLFSAGFGIGLRPLISDFVNGVGLIFEDTFAVGEKVQIQEVEGIVEEVNLRTTWIRAPTGELYVVPNGEVRVVRNFSRGKFSTVKVQIKVITDDLGQVLEILESLSREAVLLLPYLLEPWQILSESGVMGHQTELTLLGKASFGKAAETRPRMLALVQERLSEADISLSE
jgi:moderate conductance mechanosensitive channel